MMLSKMATNASSSSSSRVNLSIVLALLWLLMNCPGVTGRDASQGYLEQQQQQHMEIEVGTTGPPDLSLLDPTEPVGLESSCLQQFNQLWYQEDEKEILNEITWAVHRNGEPDECGTVRSSIHSMLTALSSMSSAGEGEKGAFCGSLTAFQMESFLTHYLSRDLALAASDSSNLSCGSTDDADAAPGLLGYCDMGPDRTVIRLDHDELIPVPSGSLPCRFYTREGVRIQSLRHLAMLAHQAKKPAAAADDDDSPNLHLYAVPAGRVFMFAPKFVGEIFHLDHVEGGADGNKIYLEVLSLNPRVFDIFHLFSQPERDDLIEKALGEKSETHKFHRSTTGTTGASVFNRRTSENAWDTHGATARKLQMRAFKLLGLEFEDGHVDGLQILRYNLTTAYIPHMDYLDDPGESSPYNYNTAGAGGNRFATILFYFSELGQDAGGETVFPSALPPGVEPGTELSQEAAIQELRQTEAAKVLKQGSWEEEMTATCRSRLAVRPKALRAALFYSQLPNGVEDFAAKHGGCPVLNGTKYAANLWIWNAPRPEFDGAPLKKGRAQREREDGKVRQIQATFRNTGENPQFDHAELYYDEDGFFGKLGPNDPAIHVNTYQTHVWNVKVNGKTLQTFVIGSDEVQSFSV